MHGYAGFSNLVEARQDASLRLVFCWAHNLVFFYVEWRAGATVLAGDDSHRDSG